VCGSSKATEDTILSEKEGTSADSEKSTLLVWVFLLDVGIGTNEAERLRFVLEEGFDVAAGNDKDVKLS